MANSTLFFLVIWRKFWKFSQKLLCWSRNLFFLIASWRNFARKKQRWESQRRAQHDRSGSSTKKLQGGGGENCSQEPTQISRFYCSWYHEGRKHFSLSVHRHSDGAECCLSAVALAVDEETYMAVCGVQTHFSGYWKVTRLPGPIRIRIWDTLPAG